jgi:site-specific recombinase XerD
LNYPAKTKLYFLSGKDFELPGIVMPDGKIKNKPAQTVPIITWPNGLTCWPVTLYLNNKYQAGKSSSNSGGTLLTYAKNLSQLLRFCAQHRVAFSELDDNKFALFITQLNDEKDFDNNGTLRHLRKSNQVLTIGRRVLEFLFWYREFFSCHHLIGEEHQNCNITVYRENYRSQGRSFGYWSHPSFPTRNSHQTRQPVNTDDLEKLFIANIKSNKSNYIIRRRAAMLHLARATGARRIELAKIKIEAILSAYEHGVLNLNVAKSPKRQKWRAIPILKSMLEPIVAFINGARASLIRNTVGKKNDNGFLFISSLGQPLAESSLTNEMHDIAKLANLDSAVCLHMFRHRYFTDMAYNFLLGIREFAERRELTAPSELIVLQQMRSLSQHENNETLMRYIHDAYKEAKSWDIGQTLWNLSQIHESMSLNIDELKESISTGQLNISQTIMKFEEMLILWKKELISHDVSENKYKKFLI